MASSEPTKRAQQDKPEPTEAAKKVAKPLWWHKGSGRWCRKRGKRFYYFGDDPRDPYSAREQHDREWPHIEKGETPPDRAGGLTVAKMCNRFIHAQTQRIGAKRRGIVALTVRNYTATCRRMARLLGPDRLVENLRGSDIAKLAAAVSESEGLALSTSARVLREIKTVFEYADKHDWIAKPAKVELLEPPTQKDIETENNNGRRELSRTYTPEQCRAMIEATEPPLQTTILLGLNCGFGNHDVGSLPLSALELDDRNNAWHTFPRPKTGVKRCCALWPRTWDSIQQALTERPNPASVDYADRVFLTRNGLPWCGVRDGGKWADIIYRRMTRLMRRLKIQGGDGRSFYRFRHSLVTWSTACADEPAVRVILGHKPKGMLGRYEHFMEAPNARERLRAVANYLHAVIFGTPAWGPELTSPPANGQPSPPNGQPSPAPSNPE